MKLDQYLELCLQLDLNLTPCSSGEYILYHHIFNSGTIFSFIPKNYYSLLMGYEPKEITLEYDYAYYDLFKNNHRIMSSSLEILFTQYIPYIRAKGNVLIGGFGLGILSKLLCMKNNINHITAIELSGDIINLCGFSDKKLTLLEGDFYSYLKENDLSKFDYIYIDVFSDSIENPYVDRIIPLKNFLFENYPSIPFDFWQEDEFKAKFLINNVKKEML